MLNAIGGVSYGQNAYLSVYASRRVAAQTGAVRPAQPDVPVQAVEPARPIARAAAVTEHPDALRRWSSDPVSMAVRSRMEYLDDAALARLRNEAGAGFAQSAPAKAYSAGAALSLQGVQGTDTADILPLRGVENTDAAGVSPLWGTRGADAAGAALPQGTQGAEKAKSAREVMEEGECQTCKERKYQDGSDDPGVSFKTARHIAPEAAAATVRGHEMEHVVREQASAAREGRRVVSQSVTYHTAICPECGKAYVSGGTTRTTTAAAKDAFAVAKGDKAEKGGFSGFSAMI